MYLSTEPVGPIAASFLSSPFPCVLIYLSNGVRGQTHMVAVAIRRTLPFSGTTACPSGLLTG